MSTPIEGQIYKYQNKTIKFIKIKPPKIYIFQDINTGETIFIESNNFKLLTKKIKR